jgi:hypothetical protein
MYLLPWLITTLASCMISYNSYTVFGHPGLGPVQHRRCAAVSSWPILPESTPILFPHVLARDSLPRYQQILKRPPAVPELHLHILQHPETVHAFFKLIDPSIHPRFALSCSSLLDAAHAPTSDEFACTLRAIDGKLDPVIGRDEEISRVIRVLARRVCPL